MPRGAVHPSRPLSSPPVTNRRRFPTTRVFSPRRTGCAAKALEPFRPSNTGLGPRLLRPPHSGRVTSSPVLPVEQGPFFRRGSRSGSATARPLRTFDRIGCRCRQHGRPPAAPRNPRDPPGARRTPDTRWLSIPDAPARCRHRHEGARWPAPAPGPGEASPAASAAPPACRRRDGTR